MIRHAKSCDASRIAEIIITNYRVNFYPFFKNDEFYFSELNVVDMAKEYSDGSEELLSTYVYDDNGVIKGIIRINGTEVVKLYVEPQSDNLWALEYNTRGIAFYKRHGFQLTGEKMIEDEWVPLVKLARNKHKQGE